MRNEKAQNYNGLVSLFLQFNILVSKVKCSTVLFSDLRRYIRSSKKYTNLFCVFAVVGMKFPEIGMIHLFYLLLIIFKYSNIVATELDGSPTTVIQTTIWEGNLGINIAVT